MAKQRISDDIWAERLKIANRYHREWSTLFKTEILQKYFEGHQWKYAADLGYTPYTINKIYETIQIKVAQFVPTFPKFLISSREGNEWEMQQAAASAQLKEDLLNQICDDNRLHFIEELEKAYIESFFGFGLIEVGYGADWIINPNAQAPLLKGQVEKTYGEAGRRVVADPPELPKNEQVFIKHIPFKTFRIGGQDHVYLSRCGWFGYYEFVNKDELLALPRLLNKDKILFGSDVAAQPEPDEPRSSSDDFVRRDSLKIWHIWDVKSSNRLLIVDSPTVTVYQRHYDHLTLYDYRPHKRLRVPGFYPIPPAFHWLSCQDEYNETREMLRAHRRRFLRKFQVVEGRVDDEEIEKFETGPDGALIKVKAPEAITPIQNADLGQALNESIATSSNDLREISGTTATDRGVSDRTTATESNIINQRTSLRETKDRDRVVDWFCQIARGILLIVNKNFTGKILVRLSSPEGSEDFLGVVQARRESFKFVSSEDLSDGYDFKIDVDLTSLSAVARVEEKQRLFEFTSFLVQNPIVAFSPYLIREAAVRIGYRNEKAIAEFQKQALLMELARMNQLQAAVGQSAMNQPGQQQMPPNGNAPQQISQQATPPDQEQLRNQLAKVLPQATQVQ